MCILITLWTRKLNIYIKSVIFTTWTYHIGKSYILAVNYLTHALKYFIYAYVNISINI